jgi:hypothetical protein
MPISIGFNYYNNYYNFKLNLNIIIFNIIRNKFIQNSFPFINLFKIWKRINVSWQNKIPNFVGIRGEADIILKVESKNKIDFIIYEILNKKIIKKIN